MSCGGGHLGFPIGIKNRNFVEYLPMIIPGMIIGMSSTNFMFLFRSKSKMAATAIYRLTLDLMENVQMPSSQKLQILLKPNCT
jgi:hypothetical protein